MADGDSPEVQRNHVQFEDPMPDDVNEVTLENGKPQRKPRRIIHFIDGSTLDEYSTDEETEEETQSTPIDPKTLDWLPWFWFYVVLFASKTFSGAEFLGEKFAWGLGITSPKYQSEINEYYRYLEEQEKLKQEEGEELVEVTSQTAEELEVTSQTTEELEVTSQTTEELEVRSQTTEELEVTSQKPEQHLSNNDIKSGLSAPTLTQI